MTGDGSSVFDCFLGLVVEELGRGKMRSCHLGFDFLGVGVEDEVTRATATEVRSIEGPFVPMAKFGGGVVERRRWGKWKVEERLESVDMRGRKREES